MMWNNFAKSLKLHEDFAYPESAMSQAIVESLKIP